MAARFIGCIPKPSTFRSEKLRRAVADLPCQACGREGFTQAAHANMGKGMGIKVSDALVAALCTKCHSELDSGGKMSKVARREFEAEMVLKTYVALIESGVIGVLK